MKNTQPEPVSHIDHIFRNSKNLREHVLQMARILKTRPELITEHPGRKTLAEYLMNPLEKVAQDAECKR